MICSNKNYFVNFINQIQIKTLKDNNDGKIIHYFIQENSLIDFLMNTEVKDYESIFNYISSVGTLCDDAIEYTLAIHSKIFSCVVYFLQKSGETEHSTVLLMNDEIGNMFFQMGVTDMNQITEEQKKVYRFLANFIYYINAFPNKIVDGTPNDMVSSERCMTRNNHKVGVDERIVESHGVSPHFRKGFFRYYKDERYVNVRGTVQFIESTFVKGKAKTVKE